MKKLVKMSRTVGTLEGLYNHLNEDFFEAKLPVPVITVQSKPGTYGHCSVDRIWKREEEDAYEMNIAAETLKEDVEEIIDTMLHEMVHLYCRENGIKEVSRGGKYHNKKFKELAEKVGLITYECGQYGWNTVGKGNDKLIEYAFSIGFYGIDMKRNSPNVAAPVGGVAQANAPITGTGMTSSTRKYMCQFCSTSFRATKNLDGKVLCWECSQKKGLPVFFTQA